MVKFYEWIKNSSYLTIISGNEASNLNEEGGKMQEKLRQCSIVGCSCCRLLLLSDVFLLSATLLSVTIALLASLMLILTSMS